MVREEESPDIWSVTAKVKWRRSRPYNVHKTSFRTNAMNLNPSGHMKNLSIKESAK